MVKVLLPAIVSIVICVFGTALAGDLSQFKSKCAEYGFIEGSEAHAACVMKLDSESQMANDQRQSQLCSDLKQQAEYWCSDAPGKKGMGSFGAVQCGKLAAKFRATCTAPASTSKR
jgi:hypothetical protein